ncbi:metal ABC transporter substrate-binding protein [Alkalilimnicola ehrlichii MLHE-1]|uniref:Periplasmic solute binding protein n=1 Tax=Alkalilimnicola ehrlichii (strain ATCC BAA-1101 / DSM 17681 / MLHE-1) TaxID=187272 RepID=Q0A9U3_ALKEH|nr:zinc ABC transporter substrate-binding protein [Alkalilimnicola ehrlichii]ABI56394.1 periplasmic solute binding protein [Alkalilimnicola ehrlichii MLHE-1]
MKAWKLVTVALLPFVLMACGGGNAAEGERPRVVATFSILGDLTREVAGDDVDLTVLTPIGAEVHEWELSPNNFMALERADLVLYNGYQLEQWMGQVAATVAEGVPMVPVAERSGHDTLPIVTGDYEGDPDPHLWMDPRAAAGYARAIGRALGEVHPERADAFEERAEDLAGRLLDLHTELTEALSAVPEERRLLITSEAAFVYFADAYGFVHDGVWGTNAETEGSPRQIMRIVDLVRQKNPGAVFWESTISDRHVRSVAEDTGVDVAGPLYVDSLGGAGSGAEDYFSLMRHNVRLIKESLSEL